MLYIYFHKYNRSGERKPDYTGINSASIPHKALTDCPAFHFDKSFSRIKMNTTDNSTTCIIQLANPDISGIGVRISFYIQIFLTSIHPTFSIYRITDVDAGLIVYISPEEATSAVWTYLSSSLGLMIAAICEARAGTLTLYQAIEVYYLLWCVSHCLLYQ